MLFFEEAALDAEAEELFEGGGAGVNPRGGGPEVGGGAAEGEVLEGADGDAGDVAGLDFHGLDGDVGEIVHVVGVEFDPGGEVVAGGFFFGALVGDGLVDFADFELELLFLELEGGQVALVALEGVALRLQFGFGVFDFAHGGSSRGRGLRRSSSARIFR